MQENVGMLALYPDLIHDEEDPITEMIFIVDRYLSITDFTATLCKFTPLNRSGSMNGAKILQTKDMLQVFMRSLPLGTLFNVSL